MSNKKTKFLLALKDHLSDVAHLRPHKFYNYSITVKVADNGVITCNEALIEAEVQPANYENCETDCAWYCTGCARSFHDIKDEEDLPHDEELPESVQNDAGEDWCHQDCYEAYWGI